LFGDALLAAVMVEVLECAKRWSLAWGRAHQPAFIRVPMAPPPSLATPTPPPTEVPTFWAPTEKPTALNAEKGAGERRGWGRGKGGREWRWARSADDADADADDGKRAAISAENMQVGR